MRWGGGGIKWSPVEVDYLKANRDLSVNQLTISLGKSRAAIKRKCDELDGKPLPAKSKKRTKIGKREDILSPEGRPLFFRSGWEANIARWLNHKGKRWEYEPEVFFFEGIKSGTMSYCPDFKTPSTWIEVKGQLTGQGKTAIRRLKKFYPEEFKKLRAITGRKKTKATEFFNSLGVPVIAYMNELDKAYKNVIPNWE